MHQLNAHNSIVVDGQNQMPKLSRFTSGNWTRSKLFSHEVFDNTSAAVMQAEHYSYKRKSIGVTHKRAVLALDNFCWLIVDDILGSGDHAIDKDTEAQRLTQRSDVMCERKQ